MAFIGRDKKSFIYVSDRRSTPRVLLNGRDANTFTYVPNLDGLFGTATGKAVQIVKYDQTKSGNAKFHYMVEEIKKIFLADDVKDKKAVIISIAGPARKGKSFMLGFFMKYLQDPDGAASWDENEPLKTFQWGGGCKSITSGLWIWNKPFISKTASGEEVAVFLMDSQGLYDRNSSMNDSTLIFAFSVLFSSIQVYNLMQDIQCNDLEHLEMFVNFGKYVENCERFQRLVFLVRDWRFVQDYHYGENGGKKFLETTILKKRPGGKTEEIHKRIAEMLERSFEDVDCFLLPHPGDIVDTGGYFENNTFHPYKGELKCMSPEFKTQLLSFISFILKPSKLKPKTIGCEEQTCRHLVSVFKELARKMNSGEITTFLDSLKPCFQGMVTAMYTNLLSDVCKYYQNEMERQLDSYKELEDLNALHEKVTKKARDKVTIENRKLFLKHLQKNIDFDLNDFFEKEFTILKLKNESNQSIFSSFTKILSAGIGTGITVGGGTGMALASATSMHPIQAIGTLTLTTGFGAALGLVSVLYLSKTQIYSVLTKMHIPQKLKFWKSKNNQKEHSD